MQPVYVSVNFIIYCIFGEKFKKMFVLTFFSLYVSVNFIIYCIFGEKFKKMFVLTFFSRHRSEVKDPDLKGQ